MTDDRDELYDEMMDEDQEPDATAMIPRYYVMEDEVYDCPLGLSAYLRYAVDVHAGGEIIAAEALAVGTKDWKQIGPAGLKHLARYVIAAELDEIEEYLNWGSRFDFERSCIWEQSFGDVLPEWALVAQSGDGW